MYVTFISINIYILINNREKRDYYIRLPTLPRPENLNIYSKDDSDNDIYLDSSEDEDNDELKAYLSEKRQNKQVSNNTIYFLLYLYLY